MTATTEIVSLDDLKEHLQVDHDDDDGVLVSMLEAARRHIEAWVGPLDAFEEVPADIVEALKRLASHFFEVRGAAGEEALSLVPFGVHDLIGPYRKWEF